MSCLNLAGRKSRSESFIGSVLIIKYGMNCSNNFRHSFESNAKITPWRLRPFPHRKEFLTKWNSLMSSLPSMMTLCIELSHSTIVKMPKPMGLPTDVQHFTPAVLPQISHPTFKRFFGRNKFQWIFIPNYRKTRPRVRLSAARVEFNYWSHLCNSFPTRNASIQRRPWKGGKRKAVRRIDFSGFPGVFVDVLKINIYFTMLKH